MQTTQKNGLAPIATGHLQQNSIMNVFVHACAKPKTALPKEELGLCTIPGKMGTFLLCVTMQTTGAYQTSTWGFKVIVA